MTDDWQAVPGPDDHGEAAFVQEVLREHPDWQREVQRRTRETLAAAYEREWKVRIPPLPGELPWSRADARPLDDIREMVRRERERPLGDF